MTFDLLAMDWDTERRINRAEIITDEIKENIEIKKEFIALDFGCGTGLLSFNLHKYFKRIDLVDSSKGMINRLNEKIKKSKISNMNPIHFDFTMNLELDKKYNVIYSSMALHHINNINLIIKKFYNLLSENGTLCIIDLNTVSEIFHKEESEFTGHHGFEILKLNEILKNSNFTNVTTKTFYHSEKKTDQEVVPYSLFMMTAIKG